MSTLLSSLYTPPIVVWGENGSSRYFIPAADTDAARGAAIIAARDAAGSGDRIEVNRPGTYEIAESLATDTVNWHFAAGVSISMATSANAYGIFDDLGNSKNYVVTGAGDFFRSATFEDDSLGNKISVFRTQGDDSNVSIECRDATMDFDGGDSGVTGSVILQDNGKLTVRGRRVDGTGSPYAVWWLNGALHVRFDSLVSPYYCIASSVDDTPTGDAYIEADEILGAGGVLSNGADTTAVMWVVGKVIKGTLPTAYSLGHTGGNKLYVHAQKLFGRLYDVGAGLFYVTSDKLSAVGDGTAGSQGALLNLTSGATSTVRLQIMEYDAAGFADEMFLIEGCTTEIFGGSYIGNASSKGFRVTGGTVRLLDCLRVDTSANSSTSPITKVGGTVILGAGATLVAHASADSIAASTAQNVKVYGTAVANKAKNANVTIQVGTLTVDANVT